MGTQAEVTRSILVKLIRYYWTGYLPESEMPDLDRDIDLLRELDPELNKELVHGD